MGSPEVDFSISGYWRFVWERHQIWIRRFVYGQPFPWTEDPILQTFHFCNVWRELDAGTLWYKEKVAKQCVDFPDLLWRTIIYRLVNNIKIFEASGGIPPKDLWKDMVDRIRAKELKIYSYAYRNFSGKWPIEAKTRLDRFAIALEKLEPRLEDLSDRIVHSKSLQEISKLLQTVPAVGSFISMQIYRDLILAGALPFTDDDWVEIGPGAKTALAQMIDRPSDSLRDSIILLRYTQSVAYKDLELPQPLLNGKDISLCDIEHSLCEWHKYTRVLTGGKRRYYRNADFYRGFLTRPLQNTAKEAVG